MATNKREALRLTPSREDPVTVAFKEEHLQKLSSEIKVLDISVGGIRLRIPGAETILEAGASIEKMELSIPGEGEFALSGTVTFIKGDQCGIKFLKSGEHKIDKIARYLFNRERAMRT
jgi:c-di-GMP-binding flagellar brake protein YcgR